MQRGSSRWVGIAVLLFCGSVLAGSPPTADPGVRNAVREYSQKFDKWSPESFRLTIPEFIGIGFDDVEFEDALEINNVLSWLTAPAVQTTP